MPDKKRSAAEEQGRLMQMMAPKATVASKSAKLPAPASPWPFGAQPTQVDPEFLSTLTSLFKAVPGLSSGVKSVTGLPTVEMLQAMTGTDLDPAMFTGGLPNFDSPRAGLLGQTDKKGNIYVNKNAPKGSDKRTTVVHEVGHTRFGQDAEDMAEGLARMFVKFFLAKPAK